MFWGVVANPSAGDELLSDEFKSVECVSVSPSGTEGDEGTSSEVRSTKLS